MHCFSSRRVPCAMLVMSALIFACRSGTKPPSGPAGASSTDASTPASPVTPLPSGLPPMANMPAPGVRGSKKATVKHDGALFSCAASVKSSTKDPADLVRRVGDACASASRMHPAGEIFHGQQADKDPAEAHKVRVDAGKCYRVYFATGEPLRDAVVVLRDSAGDTIAESTGPALVDDGSVCFNTADEITILISAGAGKGNYAVQLWSD